MPFFRVSTLRRSSLEACGEVALHWTASRSCRRGGMLFGTSAPSSHDSLTSDTSDSGAPRLRMRLSWGRLLPQVRGKYVAVRLPFRGLAPPAATALASRPRPGTYTNAPYACDPTSQPPGAPHPTAVWHGKLAMWALSENGRWFERGHAVDADTQPRPHHARDVARREWCGLVRRSRPACTNACLRGP